MELMRLFYPNHPPATISALLGDRIGVLRKTPRVEQALLSWHEEATKVEWTTPQDIKARYPTASFVGKSRVLSNIKGTITGYSWRPPQNWCHPYQTCRHHGALEDQCLGSNGGGRVCSQESNATAAIGHERFFAQAGARSWKRPIRI